MTTADALPAGYEQVYNRADAAMYAAKRAGGDSVVTDPSAVDPRSH